MINVAGHRLSTGRWRRSSLSHKDVAERAVVGVADRLKGQIPIGFAVLKAGVDRPDEDVAAELIALVRERVGPVASFKTVAIVDALPKTRSGKTLRATIRKMADGEQWTRPADDRGRHRARRLRRAAAQARIRKSPNPSGITRPTRFHNPARPLVTAFPAPTQQPKPGQPRLGEAALAQRPTRDLPPGDKLANTSPSTKTEPCRG